MLVIKLLDMVQAAGFKVDASDEGKYWETRDLGVLAKNINDYTVLVSGVFDSLKQACDESEQNLSVQSPIEHCKNLVAVRKKSRQV